MLNEKEITSLIQMLDDPDEAIAENIISQLVKTSLSTIPQMQEIWEINLNPIVEQRMEEIEYEIKKQEAISFFSHWKTTDKSVMEAWMFISEMLDPDYNKENILNFVNKLRFDTWKEYNNDLTTIEKCKILAFILQDIHQLSINDDSQTTNSSMYILSKVAINKQCARTSRTILFQEIASKLDIDLFGLNYFEYAILGCFSPDSDSVQKSREDVLFYLIFGEKIHLIGNHQLDLGMNIDDASLYTPTTSEQIVHKVLYGLKNSYNKENQTAKEDFCNAIIQLLMI